MNYKENVSNEKNNTVQKGNVSELLSKIFSFKNIMCFLMVYLVSKLQFSQGVTPFNYAIVGAMQVFNIPLFLTLSAGILGVIAGGFSEIVLIKYIVTVILFTLISTFIKIEGINKKLATALKLATSIIIVEGILMLATDSILIGGFNLTYLLLSTMLFYIVFVAATYVIVNVNKTVIFSKEELIAFTMVLVLSITGLGKTLVYGIEIKNILGIFLVLLLGYKNGWIIGCTSGTVIGLVVGIVANTNPLIISMYALCGLLSGLLNKVGKVGVIAGFFLGSIFFRYISGEDAMLAMRLSEIMIASFGLLLMPKRFELRVDSLFNKNIMLESSYGKVLADSENVKMKLEAIGDVFDNLASNIENVKIDNITKQESKEVVKSYLLNYKEKECLGCENFKTCLADKKLDLAVDYIVDSLEENKYIKGESLNISCDKDKFILNDIKEIYKNIKIAYVLKQKELENSKKISNQYREVSKVINSIANNIIVGKKKSDDIETEKKLNEELKIFGYNIFDSEYKISKNGYIEFTFITDILNNIDIQKVEIKTLVSDVLEKEMKIKLILNSSKTEKAKIKLVSNTNFDIKVASKIIAKEEESGDNIKIIDLEDNKKVIMISDGEGNGTSANTASLATISMLEKLLKSGFSEDKSIEIVDNLLKMRGENERFASIDIAILDEQNEKVEFIKFGAAPSFVISKNDIYKIKSNTLPAGIVEDFKFIPDVSKIVQNDVIVMMSDGVFSEELSKEEQEMFIDMLKDIDLKEDENKILDEINNYVLNNYEYKDDATIVVIKIK